jgi:hypothetical protein
MPQGPGGVIFCTAVRAEPASKRVAVFVDGQNLYRCVKDTFGCSHPNYDVVKLAQAVCKLRPAWNVSQVRFYTGFPDPRDEPLWNQFWTKKLLAIRRQGVHVYSRSPVGIIRLPHEPRYVPKTAQ